MPAASCTVSDICMINRCVMRGRASPRTGGDNDEPAESEEPEAHQHEVAQRAGSEWMLEHDVPYAAAR